MSQEQRFITNSRERDRSIRARLTRVADRLNGGQGPSQLSLNRGIGREHIVPKRSTNIRKAKPKRKVAKRKPTAPTRRPVKR